MQTGQFFLCIHTQREREKERERERERENEFDNDIRQSVTALLILISEIRGAYIYPIPSVTSAPNIGVLKEPPAVFL